MSTKRSKTDSHSSTLPDITDAFRLLDEHNFEQLAMWLVNAQQHPAITTKHERYHHLLGLISHLALSCHLLHKSAAWHQAASEQASRYCDETHAALHHAMQMMRQQDWLHNSAASAADEHLAPAQPAENLPFWSKLSELFHALQTPLATVADVSHTMSTANNAAHDAALSQWVTTWSPPEPAIYPQDISSSAVVEQPAPTNDDDALYIYGLSNFTVYFKDKLVTEWGTRKSKSIFKYLLLNRSQPVPKEMLMDVFWQESEETAARNNLNVTIYNLRQALRNIDDTTSYVLYHNGCYSFNPSLAIWFDYELFNQYYKRGCQLMREGYPEEALQSFQKAEILYERELFAEDRYDNWLFVYRDTTQHHYIDLVTYLAQSAFDNRAYVESINLCRRLLRLDPCLEEIHRLLMHSYMQQGQNHLAVRQYYTCVDILETELGVCPSKDTLALYSRLRA